MVDGMVTFPCVSNFRGCARVGASVGVGETDGIEGGR